MFCQYCQQLFSFRNAATRLHTVEKVVLGDSDRNQRSFKLSAQKRDPKRLPAHTGDPEKSSSVKIHEDDGFIGLDGSPDIWWKIPILQDDSNNLLTHSPSSGCQICAMVFSDVSGSILAEIAKVPRDHGSAPSFIYRSSNKGPSQTLSIWLDVSGQFLPMIQLHVTHHMEPRKLMGEHNGQGTGSSSTFSLAASWIDTCNRKHPKCTQPQVPNFRLPSRLIDVGSIHQPRAIRLWIPGHCSAPVPYLTLSHRWGNLRRQMLTKVSLPALCEKIEVSELPQSYKDAITITQNLGIRYLWIDSLCIIQDSEADWQAESSVMDEVYRFSYCTIAASWALNDTEGFLVDRGPLQARIPGSQMTIDRGLLGNGSAVQLSEQHTDQLTEAIDRLQAQNSRFDTTSHETRIAREHGSSAGDLSDDVHRTRRRVRRDRDKFRRARSTHELDKTSSTRRTRWRQISPVDESPSQQQSELKMPVHSTPRESRSEELVFYIKPLQKDLWAHLVDSSPLNSRAWVLQERLLSRRLLYFTKTQLFWECKETKASESYPTPVEKVVWEPFQGPRNLSSTHDLQGLNVEPLHEHWTEIVEAYTTTYMTRPGDKLAAISGLAKEVQSHTNDKYCAGLWRKDIMTQLLWRLQQPQIYRGPGYRAPTWSWASVDGRVKFAKTSKVEGRTEFAISITSVTTEGVNSKPWSLGQIAYASISVLGKLLTVQQCEWRDNAYLKLLMRNVDEEFQGIDGEFHPDVILRPPPENLFCLPVLSFTPEDRSEGNGHLIGLVLTPTGEFRDEYQRVGIVRLQGSAYWTYLNGCKEQDVEKITII